MSRFRVVFRGEVFDGFDRALVLKVAALRMKASPSQIEKIFSGRKVILKKGLTENKGALYIGALEQIGMRVKLEPEPLPKTAPADPASQPHTAPREQAQQGLNDLGDEGWSIASSLEQGGLGDNIPASLVDTDVNELNLHQYAQNSAAADQFESAQALIAETHINYDLLAKYLESSAQPVASTQRSDEMAIRTGSAISSGESGLAQAIQNRKFLLAQEKLATEQGIAVAATSAASAHTAVAVTPHEVQCPHCGQHFPVPTAAEHSSLRNGAQLVADPANAETGLASRLMRLLPRMRS